MALIGSLSRRRRGVTLVELMVAMAILSTGVLAFIAAFGGVAKSIQFSKSRTIATNLAQEKVESLKNLSYYRLMVTTAAVSAAEPGVDPFLYDPGYYSSEEVVVGQIPFIRRVYVQKMTESDGVLVPNAWYEDDSGIKRITVNVMWEEGQAWKTIALTNLRDNPARQKIDAQITGVVGSAGIPLSDAQVVVLQNLQLKDTSDSDGQYAIAVSSGTYTLRASRHGFFSQTVTVTAPSGAATEQHFDLTEMAVGSVSGVAYVRDRLLLSAVCAEVDGDPTIEFVQLYNPTENPIVIDASGGVSPNFQLRFVRASDGSVTVLNPPGETVYVAGVVPPHGFFLLASTPNVRGVPADAYYSNAGMAGSVPVDRLLARVSGGVALTDVDGDLVDALGWGRSPPYGPAQAREGTGVRLGFGPLHGGLDDGEMLERIAYSTSTRIDMAVAPLMGIHAWHGNAYDTDDNDTNWVHHEDPLNIVPQNTSVTEAPGSGRPAVGAMVFVYDGLSGAVVAGAGPPLGRFMVTNVATGTWTVFVSSSGWSNPHQEVEVIEGVTADLGNVFLTTPLSMGFVTGGVVDGGGAALPGIMVGAGGESDTTDSMGRFRLPADPGQYIVVANPNNQNSSYTTAEVEDVVVIEGEVTALGSDMVLFEGGRIHGFMTTNGTDPLPGIPVIATDTATGAEVGSSVTDALGEFAFFNLPVGAYTVFPQLEPGESALPSTLHADVEVGGLVSAGVFVVSNAFGAISGMVTIGGRPIETGVLVMAVPDFVGFSGTTPPQIDDDLRNSPEVYYFATSDATGSFTIPVRGGFTYDLRAWYTTIGGGTPTTTMRAGTAVVSAGGAATVNFLW